MTATGSAPRLRGRACLGLAGLLAAAAFVPSAAAAATAPLDTAEAGAANRLVDTAYARLPSEWRAALPATPTIDWRDDLPAHVTGRAFGKQLRLDRSLLAAWKHPEVDPEHDPAARLGLATLIHELAHVLDRGPQGGLSSDPRLRDLAGWPRRRFWPGRSDNILVDRSPDRYELHDPREFVAVNLEHFVLDVDYACRRPALAAWFQSRVGKPPGARSDCSTHLPLLQGEGNEGQVGWLDLDPARVYAIDYLFAEGNDEPMSRWGHAMLRLVICAPGRPLGPDCRLDLAEHRVLSFRAFVDDVQISSWRGLTGGYPSRLYVLPLEQVIDDYTQVQLRALSSVPLALDRQGINAILERAARLHWSYDGRYAFLSNNCAVETWKLLRDADPRIEARTHWRGIAPNSLLAALERTAMADGTVLNDTAAAQAQGYYFASAAARYDQMFNIARERLPLPANTAQAWLDLPAGARAPWIERADLRATAALLLLEQAAGRRQEMLARDWLKRRLSQRDGEAEEARGQVRELLSDAGTLARPAALLASVAGYGLPQTAEREEVEQRLAARNQRLSQGWPALRAAARQALPEKQQSEWNRIDQNLQQIQHRLRELATVQ